MYIPTAFREDKLESLHEIIRSYAFGTLVTYLDGCPFATHLPFLLDSSRGVFGTLRAHMARPNPQWKGFGTGDTRGSAEAMVIFQGPHAYISPSWYLQQPSVPTWNYIAVHAYGSPRCVADEDLKEILMETVATFEVPGSEFALPDEYFQKMAAGVVGFEIEITQLEGKCKLSQNRSAEDRRVVIAELSKSESTVDRETAEWMQRGMVG